MKEYIHSGYNIKYDIDSGRFKRYFNDALSQLNHDGLAFSPTNKRTRIVLTDKCMKELQDNESVGNKAKRVQEEEEEEEEGESESGEEAEDGEEEEEEEEEEIVKKTPKSKVATKRKTPSTSKVSTKRKK